MAGTRTTAIIVASALFMQNLDSSAVVTALPAMARDLNEDPARLGVAITSYLVALTVFIPVSGYVADRFGAKRVFLMAILLFGTASAACGFANSLGELVAARVFQGMAGAMMVPVGRLLLLSGIRKDEMLTAMAWLTMPAMLGPITGPPLGGIMTDLFGWRSVFWLNVPVALLGFALVAWKITPLPVQNPGPPDIKGLLLVGGALATLMAGFETVGRGVLPAGMPAALLVLGGIVALLALRHCRRATRPAIDLTLLRFPSFHHATLAGSLFRAGAGGVPFLVPLLLQLGFGWSATQAGLVAFATALGAFAMKPLARPVLRRWGFRNVLVANGLLAAAGVAVGAAFSPAWPVAALFVALALGGLFRSLQFTSLNTLAFADIPRERLSAGTSFYGTAQQLPPAIGVVIASTALEVSQHLAGRDALAVADFTTAFLVAGLVVASAAPLALRLPRDVGAEVSGKSQRQEMNRRIPLSPGRRLMGDLSAASRSVPRFLIRGRLSIPRARAARAALPAPRPPWTTLFAKAFAMAAQQHAPLRRVHASLPWPHLIEAPHAQGCVMVEARDGEEALLAPARLFRAHDAPLPDLARRLAAVKSSPREASPALRWMLAAGRLPWPLRRSGYALSMGLGWPVLRLGGNYAISALGEHGAELLDSVSIVPVFLSFGPIAPDGGVNLHFAMDHRVLDGSDAIRAMAAMQAALEGPIAEELAALDAPPPRD